VLLARRRSHRVWLGDGNGGVATVVRGSFAMLITRSLKGLVLVLGGGLVMHRVGFRDSNIQNGDMFVAPAPRGKSTHTVLILSADADFILLVRTAL